MLFPPPDKPPPPTPDKEEVRHRLRCMSAIAGQLCHGTGVGLALGVDASDGEQQLRGGRTGRSHLRLWLPHQRNGRVHGRRVVLLIGWLDTDQIVVMWERWGNGGVASIAGLF
jgi:hypothetical protein